MNATRKRDRLKMDFMNYAELREFMCPGYDAMREALEKAIPLMERYAMRSTVLEPSVDRILPAMRAALGEAALDLAEGKE